MKSTLVAHGRLGRHVNSLFKTVKSTIPRRRAQAVALVLCLFSVLGIYLIPRSELPFDLTPFGGGMLQFRSALISRYSHVLVSDCAARIPNLRGHTTRTDVKGVRVSYTSWSENASNLHTNLRAYPPVRILSKFRRPATLLDVGANVGKITFPTLALPGPHTVIAVEPVRKNMDTLCMTASLNGWLDHPGLVLIQAALSDVDSTVRMFVPDGREDNSALNEDAATANVHGMQHGEDVYTVQGDGLLAKGAFRPDIIKIDTQGHELFVMKGLRNYLKHAEGVLVIAESDGRLMKKSNVHPTQIYMLMVEELGYTPFSKVDVSVVNDVLHVSGDVITEDVYPPRATRDIFYFKTQ